MISKSPLMYLTLPLALAFGLIWYRRKKVHCDTGGGREKARSKSLLDERKEEILDKNKRHDLKHSLSVPIGRSPVKTEQTSPLNNNESFDIRLGKSAPIDITPNKISPYKGNDKAANAEEEAKNKGQPAESKGLNSIEEHSFESVDLPSSIGCRRRFSFTIKSQEPAVVVKASNMADSKSPSSSFEDVPVTSPDGDRKIVNKNPVKTDKIEKKRMSTAIAEPKKKGESKNLANNNNNKISNNNNNNSSKIAATFQTNTNEQAHNLPISSPPLSLCSNKSHESGDSGKGSSPPNSEGGQTLSTIIAYDFELPQSFIGYLVGKGGCHVQHIKEKSGASILVRRHPESKKYKLCTVEGTQAQVDEALAIIKSKLPQRVTIKRYVYDEDNSKRRVLPVSTIDSSLLQLNLIDGINNDVIISTVIDGGHLFLQQPLHPSYPSLNMLQNCMNQSYSSFESPLLPNYNANTVCVGLIDGHWYRLQIIEHIPDETMCLAKYLDYGGYCHIQTTELRQIRTDFMSVPFQAIECFLSDIKPKDGQWTDEACRTIVELTQFRTLQAQVAGYTENGIPEILLYSFLGPNHIVYINQELVARNFAIWSNATES